MATEKTKYAVYTTEDDGVTLNFLGESEAYARKDAISALLGQETNAELRGKVERGEAPKFFCAPSSTMTLVAPQVKTEVKVTF
jgi:hypothetical protein